MSRKKTVHSVEHLQHKVVPGEIFKIALNDVCLGLPKFNDVFVDNERTIKDINNVSFSRENGRWYVNGTVNISLSIDAYGCHNIYFAMIQEDKSIAYDYLIIDITLPHDVIAYPNQSINILHAATVQSPTNLLIYPYSRYQSGVDSKIPEYQNVDFAKSEELWWGTSTYTINNFNNDITQNVPGLFTIYSNKCWDLLKKIPGFNEYMSQYVNVIVVYDLSLNYDPTSHSEELFTAANHACDITNQKNPVGWSNAFEKSKVLLGFKDIGGGQASSYAAWGSARDTFVHIQPIGHEDQAFSKYGSYDAWGFYHEFVGHCVIELCDEYLFVGGAAIDSISPENQYIEQHYFDRDNINESYALQADYVSEHPWFQYSSNSNLTKTEKDFFWYPLIQKHKQGEYLNVVSSAGFKWWVGDDNAIGHDNVNRGVYTSTNNGFMKSSTHVYEGASAIWTGWYRFLLWKKLYIDSNPNDFVYSDFQSKIIGTDNPVNPSLGTSEENWQWDRMDKSQFDALFGGNHIKANYEFMMLFKQQVQSLLERFIILDKPFAKL